MLADKVSFHGDDATGRQKRFFVEALNAVDSETGSRLLHLPQLLAWMTGYRTFNRDLSLRPCKGTPHRTSIVFISIDDQIDCYFPHTCFYQVDAPRFETQEEMLEVLRASYKTEGFNQR